MHACVRSGVRSDVRSRRELATHTTERPARARAFFFLYINNRQ
jgi:hypothetical protein